MKNYTFVFISVCLLFFHTTQAQNRETKNKIGIGGGYIHGAYKNLTLSPVVLYNYGGAFSEFNYTRRTKKNKLIEFDLKMWDLKLESDKIPVLDLEYSSNRLGFAYLMPISDKNNLTIHSGFFTQSIFSLYGNVVAVEFQQKLGLMNRIYYRINDKHSISSQLTIPFLLFVSGNIDVDIYSLAKYQGFIWSADYYYLLSQKFEVALRYYTNYDRIKSTNIFRELQNQFTVGVNYKF